VNNVDGLFSDRTADGMKVRVAENTVITKVFADHVRIPGAYTQGKGNKGNMYDSFLMKMLPGLVRRGLVNQNTEIYLPKANNVVYEGLTEPEGYRIVDIQTVAKEDNEWFNVSESPEIAYFAGYPNADLTGFLKVKVAAL
jgi:hypothetical protein